MKYPNSAQPRLVYIENEEDSIFNESYENFAEKLETEYETEEEIKFGIIEKHSFANLSLKQEDGSYTYIGKDSSELIYEHFEENGYIDNAGTVQQKFKIALKDNTLEVPAKFNEIKSSIITICKKATGKLNIKNNSGKKKIELNKQVYLSPEFKELW